MGLNFECEKCKGTGLIWGTSESNGLIYENVRDCDCMLPAKIDRMLKKSGVDYEKYAEMSLGNFLVDTDEATKMRNIATAFLETRNSVGLGFFGKSGTGKTHICIAVCQEITRQTVMPHRYFSYRGEIQKLKSVMYDKEAYERKIAELSRVKVLYVDDLYKLAKNGDKFPMQDLQIMYSIINNRYINKRATLFSSEYSLKEITDIDEATGSRIYDMCYPNICKCEGENRRLRRKH
ncbi:MAG: ATP-binding protein [Clostridiales Family XIII bacterium]|nr:ATP-binding protein [Clostridiales Family XIII bacterium]